MRLAEVTAVGTGRRGAGLGNEVIAWGKSHVAADVLGLRLGPRWLLNRYDLGAQVGLGRSEMPPAVAARVLPSVEVTESFTRATGRADDGEALVTARDEGGLDGSRLLVTSGMWGGYAAIARARRPLRDRLLGVSGARESLAYAATSQAAITVGLHVRRGGIPRTWTVGGFLQPPSPDSLVCFRRPLPT